MKNGLEVFDFKEGDEIAELAAGKFLAKFRNPNDVMEANNHNPALLKYKFLECVSQGSDVPRKDVGSLPCIDVDTIESDCSHGAPIVCTLVAKDFDAEDGDPDLGVSNPSTSLIHEKRHDTKIEVCESKSCLTEPELRHSASWHEAPSPVRSKSNSNLSYSPSNSGPVNVKSDADERMDEGSPSSPTCNIAKDGVILSSHPSNTCFTGSETDGVNVAVDYVVYCDNYCTGCSVIFSSNGIKIRGSSMTDLLETLNFEKSIDDIIQIESQHLQRFETVMIKLQVLSETGRQAGNADGISGIEELEFAAVDPDWSGKWEEITAMNVKYSALWSVVHDLDVSMDEGTDLHRQRPYYPSFDEAFEDVIYPKGDSDAVSISKRDVDLLQPETFVNDTIIDFYIKYLKNQIPQDEKDRFHFFNSFFFRKLADLDKDPSSASDGSAAFLRVHKWTRKVDLFGKDYIFIPVNFNLHWSLLVLCHLGEVASSNDRESGRSPRIPCVLHMDSIKGTHAGLKNLVQSYLWEEWKERHKETPEDISTKFLNLRFVPLELPQQENSFDCGLFLLHYLELFLVEAPLNFSPFSINEYSKFLTADWFAPVEASLKRTLIQRLISELLENRSQEVSTGECSDEEQAHCFQNGAKVSRVEFVCEGFTPDEACQGSLSNSETGQGIEMTLLDSSSVRNSHCVNDPGLVLREFFEPGGAAGSLLTHCSSFGRPSYYSTNGAMSQIEDDVEAGDQLMYFASRETVFQQIADRAPQVSGVPFSFSRFGADASWNLRTSMQEEDYESTSEASICASDDSDVGIIENCHIEDTTHYQDEKNDQQRSQSMENIGCLTESFASASNGMQETGVVECTEDDDTDKMHVSNENGDLDACPENPPPPLHEWPNDTENGLQEEVEKTEVSNEEAQIIGDDAMAEVDEQEAAERVAELDEHQAAKRRRLSPTLEVDGSLPEDLHL